MCSHASRSWFLGEGLIENLTNFSKLDDLIATLNKEIPDSVINDPRYKKEPLAQGQLKNFIVEEKVIRMLDPKIIYYSHAAPGHHVLELIRKYPKISWILSDPNPSYFNNRLAPHVKFVNHKFANEERLKIDLHIDDGLDEPVKLIKLGKAGLFKLRVLRDQSLRLYNNETTVYWPPCSGVESVELRQLVHGQYNGVTIPLLSWDRMLKQLSIARLANWGNGNCRDCLSTHLTKLNIRPHVNFADMDQFHKKALETIIGKSFDYSFSDTTEHHGVIKAFRLANRALTLRKFADRKIVEAGPKFIDLFRTSSFTTRIHCCCPKITIQDRDIGVPDWVSTCQHKVEDCDCKGFVDADLVFLSDVYVEEDVVRELIDSGKDVAITYCALPTGTYETLGVKVRREEGRLYVVPDSADKEYNDPDPEEFAIDSTVVVNTGIYKTRLFSSKAGHHLDPAAPMAAFKSLVIDNIQYFQPTALIEHVGINLASLDPSLHYKTTNFVVREHPKLKISDVEAACVMATFERAERTVNNMGAFASLIRKGHDIRNLLKSSYWKDCILGILSFNPNNPVLVEVCRAIKQFFLDWADLILAKARDAAETIAEALDFAAKLITTDMYLFKLLRKGLLILAKVFRMLATHGLETGDVSTFLKPDREPELANFRAPEQYIGETSLLDVPHQIGPLVEGVPPAHSVDRKDTGSFLHCLKKRLEVDKPTLNEEHLGILREEIGKVLDEIRGSEIVQPLDFRSGCLDSQESSNAGITTPGTIFTSPEMMVGELFDLNGCFQCRDSLKTNLPNQVKLSTSSPIETHITKSSLGPWWHRGRDLLDRAMFLPRFLVIVTMLDVLWRNLMKSQPMQSTRLIIQRSMRIKDHKSCAFSSRKFLPAPLRTFFGKIMFLRRTWNRDGLSEMVVGILQRAAVAAATSIQPSEIPYSQKHLSELLQGSLVFRPGSCAKGMIMSLCKRHPELMTSEFSSSLASMLNASNGHLSVKLNSVLGSCCRARSMANVLTNMLGFPGRSFGTLLGLLDRLDSLSVEIGSGKKSTWKSWLITASQSLERFAVDGQDWPESQTSIEYGMAKTDTESNTTVTILDSFLLSLLMLELCLPQDLESPFGIKLRPNSISITWMRIPLFTIHFSFNSQPCEHVLAGL